MRAYSTVGFAAIYNPMVIASDRRTWIDTNNDDIAPEQRDRTRRDAVQHQRRQQPRSPIRTSSGRISGNATPACSVSFVRASRCRPTGCTATSRRSSGRDNILVNPERLRRRQRRESVR